MDSTKNKEEIRFVTVKAPADFPGGVDRDLMIDFFHENLKPFHDSREDVARAIDDVFAGKPGPGGFILLAFMNDKLVGALLMLGTGMKGYVPENILLFVGVLPSMRGRGIGGELVRKSVGMVEGNVKLHVEYDNPAKRLYERLGFVSKYADMRLAR